MKKKLSTICFAWLLLLLGNLSSVYATHMKGGDIFYTWISGNTYNVTIYFYRDCDGSPAPNQLVIQAKSASCSYVQTYNTNPVLIGEVSAVCPSQLNNTTCGNGNNSLIGVEKYSYSRQITLPYNCSDWVFSWRSCCRNILISTINQAANGDSIYMEATLNNLVASVNNSPTFTSLPVPYFCAGQPTSYNHGAVDIDGDSLVYEIIAPMMSTSTTVNFINPYSALYPIATTPANNFIFSPLTGQMVFTPAQVQQGVTAILVKEYRNGVLIGSTMRDIQLVILSCGNNSPVSVGSVANVNGATNLGSNVFKACAGTTMSFSITATDPNANTNISMSSNTSTAIPGSVFTASGTNPKTGTFTWTPSTTSVGYKAFTITISDGACPIPSTQVIGFAINVIAVDLSAPDFTLCPGVTTALQLGVNVGGSPNCLSGTCLTWTPSTGLNATNIANPIATVSQPITYTVNFNDGLCNVSKQVNILPAGSIVITTPDTAICPGASIHIYSTNSFPAAINNNCNLNNALCVGGVNTYQVGTAATTTNNATNLGIGTPYQGLYSDGRVQYLYKAAELTAAGLVPGLIRSVAFDVTDLLSTNPYTGMTIKIGCYSGASLSAGVGFVTTNMLQVYSGSVAPVLSWNTYNFTTPFQWGGTLGIIIEVCYNNTNLSSDFDHVSYTATTFNSVLYKNANGGAGCTLTGPLASMFRPNAQFTNCSQALPVTFSWTSISGSPASTLNSTISPSPTASPTLTNTQYVITATNGACTLKDTIKIDQRPQPTIVNAPNMTICPLDSTVLVASGTYINSYSWSTGTLGNTITVAPLNTTTYSVYAFTDCGTLKDTIKVITSDNISPTILNCPPNDTVYVAPGTCTYSYSWIPPTVTDNCPFPTITQIVGSPSGTPLSTGNHIINYKAEDNKGNNAFCVFNIFVRDTFPPVINNCPADITVNNTPNQCGKIVAWAQPTRTDNCANTSLVQTTGLPSNSFFPIGTTLITYIATDPSGNKDTCTFNITVIDNQFPILILPANLIVPADSGLCSAVVTWNPATATDNCPNWFTTQISGIANGDTFPLGTSQIVYIATDSVGNVTAPDTMTITVLDMQAPDFVGCPTDIIVSNDTHQCGTIVSWTVPIAIDNCQGVVPVSVLSTAQPGDFFPIGTTTITYSAQDVLGNTDTCRFTITVSDNQFPLIVGCPLDITVPKDTNACGATVTWVEPTASDNCSGMTFLQTAGLPSGSFFPIGPTNIVYTATDSVGNVSICAFQVFVQDAFFPVIQNCPTNISVVNDTNVCGAVINWVVPTVFDNCPGATLSIVTGLATGSIFPIGTTTVTLVATDLALNTDTCIFTVTVTDTQFPVLQSCPNDTTINSALGLCGSNVSWNLPTIFDNCPNSVLVGSATPGDYFPIGTTTITYIATDSDNHSDTCSFNITLNDTEAPVFSGCPADIFQSSTPTSCDAIVTWTPPTVTDNCALMSVTSNFNSGDVFGSGTTTVIYIATDSVGNVDSCFFNVTISDSTAPVISGCPANIFLNANGNCQAIATWTAPTVTDNCPGVTMSVNYSSGAPFNLGTTTVLYIAIDGVGNADTCSFTVTVTDSVAPVITNCPTNIYFALTLGCDTSVTWLAPTADDNCAIASFTSNYNIGDTFAIGSYTVVYIAIDSAGNADTCSFNIVIDPAQPLTLAGNVVSDVHCLNGNDGSIFIGVTGGSGNYTYSWTTNPVQTTDTATNLTVGTYIVFVTDSTAAACVPAKQDTFTIVQLPIVDVTATGKDVSCFGLSDGSALASVTGGTPPYQYLWNDGDTLANSPNLPVGYYLVTVTDAYNCTDTASVTLIQPDSLSVSQTQTNVDCYNNTTGSASVNVSGGTPPYIYSWNNNATTSSISNLADGTYSVLITDKNACSVLKTFVITQPNLLTVTLTKTPVICHNSFTGNAFAAVQGGTSPYNIVWNTNPIQTGDTATNLHGGTYLVTVTDSQSCVTQKYITLENPPLLGLTLDSQENTYCSLANGSISVHGAGGLAPYTYTWNTDPLQTGTHPTLLMAGDYLGWITDSLGCQDTLKVTLTDTPAAVALFTSNPTNDNDILLSQATISFQNQSTGAFAYSWDFGDTHISPDINPKHTYFKEGTYTVELTAFNEFWVCPTTYSLTYNIIFDGAIFLPNAFSPNDDGKNDFFGAIGDGIVYYQMTIFDRWGKLVFLSENPATQWDGTDKGQAVPEGVYTYHLKYRLNNSATKDLGGTVTLIR